jgi:ribose transport system substrate-binding protein
MGNTMRWPLAAVVLACAATVAAGCGSDDDSGSAAAGSGEPTGKVLYLVPTLDDEAYVRQQAAAKAEAEKYPNIEFDITAGRGRTDATDLVAKIESGVTQGVDVIVVDSGSAGDQLKPALSRAIEQGVKVIVNSQPIEGLDTVTATVRFDHEAGAVPGGEYMAQELKSGDEVGMIRCVIGTPATDARAAGFEKGMEGSGIKVVATGDAECDPEKARSITENMLTAHPNLKGILSDTDIAVIGALEALEAAKKDLVVVGHDGQVAALEAIRDGRVLDASAVYPYNLFGVEGVKAAAGLIEGDDVPAQITIPPQELITKDNVQSFLDEANASR